MIDPQHRRFYQALGLTIGLVLAAVLVSGGIITARQARERADAVTANRAQIARLERDEAQLRATQHALVLAQGRVETIARISCEGVRGNRTVIARIIYVALVAESAAHMPAPPMEVTFYRQILGILNEPIICAIPAGP